jgi:hypothetical protein
MMNLRGLSSGRRCTGKPRCRKYMPTVSHVGIARNAKKYGKQTLLFDKYQSSDVRVASSSMNVPQQSPMSSAPVLRKQESLRPLVEDPDDSESFVDNRALTRRGRALQPFKSCVKCLLD